jgi:hypothetical protein
MGGGFSGRWRCHTKATAVEWCRCLDVNQWVRKGGLKAGLWLTGAWRWYRDATCQEQLAAIGYELNTLDMASPWVRLFYTFTNTGERLDYCVDLQTTQPNFGGVRWWFSCPISVDGRACRRRAAKLYLPPGGRYYGCRHCHRLTYLSSQGHDKRVDELRRNPAALEALLNNLEGASLVQLALALKALPLHRRSSSRPRYPEEGN